MKQWDAWFKSVGKMWVVIGLGLVIVPGLQAQIIPLEDLDFSTWHRRITSDGTGAGGALNAIDPDKTSSGMSGMVKVDPLDPSTWTVAQSWQRDWQGQDGAFSSLTNSTHTNLPWMVFSLGAEVPPDKMYLWNVSEATGSDRGIRDFYLFYSVSPTVPLTQWVKNGTLPSAATEYDFESGGWTQFGGVHTLDLGSGAGAIDLLIDLTSISSARYIGIAPINNHGAPESRGTGLCTAVFSRIPPPEGTLITLY